MSKKLGKNIRLSPQHGLNPAIPLCFFCLEPKNEVLIPGALPNDMPAPQNAVWDWEPCEKCKDWMERGILLISFSESLTSDMTNPYRTGGWVVVKEDAVVRMLDKATARKAREVRFLFVTDEAWEALGLPGKSQHNTISC